MHNLADLSPLMQLPALTLSAIDTPENPVHN